MTTKQIAKELQEKAREYAKNPSIKVGFAHFTIGIGSDTETYNFFYFTGNSLGTTSKKIINKALKNRETFYGMDFRYNLPKIDFMDQMSGNIPEVIVDKIFEVFKDDYDKYGCGHNNDSNTDKRYEEIKSR